MRRGLFIALALAAWACGGSPSAPSSSNPGVSAADASGLWQGTLKYTQCNGMRHCFARVGTSESFTLRVQQTGARVRALFTLSTLVVELNGDVLKDGTMQLTGAAPFASETTRDFDVAVTVTRFSVALAPASQMTGSVGYELRANQTNSEFVLATLAADIVNASRTDLALFTSTFDGTWKGRFIVRACTPTGRYCYPYQSDELSSFELQLAQDGDRVTGTFTNGPARVPVTGRAAGSGLVLEGEVQTPASGGPSVTRLTAWSTTRDAFGRMQGTFDYTFAFPMGAPALGESAHAELWQVVKVP